MKTNVKKHDFIMGFSYLTVLALSLALAACGKNSSAPKTDIIRCDQTIKAFQLNKSDERLKLSQLTPGLYDYAGGDYYFQSSDPKSPLKIQTEETAYRNPKSREMDIQHQYVCREDYSKIKGDHFKEPVGEAAPRLLMVGESSNQLDVVERTFQFGLQDGYPLYRFFEDASSQHKTTSPEFESKLKKTWDDFYFVHTGIRQYSFIAKKKIKEGTLWVRILYVKTNGNLLTDGDIFLPLPEISF
jgi:hypothetical protein